ncbi:MAG: glycosyltransferase family 2 protein [Rhizobacter sp.]|nr:glycosyltransferase family 2 protein [Rhizobacter sp.]
MTLSVILATQNDAHQVQACLDSVAFADEWIVVDAGSSDATCEIAAACGAKVIMAQDWTGVGAQRNRALDHARGAWVLSLDAGERVSEPLARSIRATLEGAREGGPEAFQLSRISRFCGQWIHHGDWYPDFVLRLFRRGTARFADDPVHERLVVDGPVALLEGDLLHDTMPNLEEALDKMNRYSSDRARDLVQRGRRGGLRIALGHGLWALLRCYLLRRGFLDGRMGLVLALYVAQGTYYRYLKMGLLSDDTAK